MMQILKIWDVIIIILIAGLVVVVGSVLAMPLVFADRGLPGVRVGLVGMMGLTATDMAGVLQQLEAQLQSQQVLIQVASDEARHTLGELGVALNITDTVDRVQQCSWWEFRSARLAVEPVLVIDSMRLNGVVQADFSAQVIPPVNATLAFSPRGELVVVPSNSGQAVDLGTFAQDVLSRAYSQAWQLPIELVVMTQAPAVHEGEVAAAEQFANLLLRDGFVLKFGEQVYQLQPFTVRRLLTFEAVPDPAGADNSILGTTFDQQELLTYFDTTLAPTINRAAINARLDLQLELTGEQRATQFSLPQIGQELDQLGSAAVVTQALAHGMTTADLIIMVTQPDVSDVTDIAALGITKLLATGTSDFTGSPANRRFNIEVGVSRYHGVLIKPGADFSFNNLLGPVDGAHGFKPELVIKKNVTVPEFGGGLCQVSTTAFRGALIAGLPITERRNHSYAVRYYGTPGFDATIYPGHTDLRFTNDTPGYLLIQARVEGTKVVFDFWGSDDGRTTIIDGPHPYGRQPNGAVKATLRQTVTRNGDVILDDTFYSNYKSPALFPRSQAIDAPAPPAGT